MPNTCLLICCPAIVLHADSPPAYQPENLLIDAQGYLKLVDWGFAKVVPGSAAGNGKTYTLCGTPDYLAPEIVEGAGYDKGVDYWALGVLLYEMFVGRSPFVDEQWNDTMSICQNILDLDVEFPEDVFSCADGVGREGTSVHGLVSGLLERDTTRRLGCLAEATGGVMAHHWFDEVPWEDMLAKRAPAPWKPVIRSPTDVSNFAQYDDEDEIIVPYDFDDDKDWCEGF